MGYKPISNYEPLELSRGLSLNNFEEQCQNACKYSHFMHIFLQFYAMLLYAILMTCYTTSMQWYMIYAMLHVWNIKMKCLMIGYAMLFYGMQGE